MKTARTSIMILSLLVSTLIACGSATDESGTDTVSTIDEGTAVDEGTAADEGAATPTWGTACESDADCADPAIFCVLNPMVEGPGYCSIKCPNGGADCTYEDWTCNVVGTCEAPAVTWCGPPAEIEESNNFLVACP